MRQSTVARGAVTLALALLALWAGTARADGTTFGITLSQCSASSSGFQFRINGAGADPTQALEVDIVTSEPGAAVEPNFIVPPGTTGYTIAAEIQPNGTFSFIFGGGSAQFLPAQITVYTFDSVTGTRAATSFYTTTVTPTTTCPSGSLAGAKTPPPPLPTTEAQCKDAGWRAYGIFKNRGDCVSFVSTGGRNKPALLP